MQPWDFYICRRFVAKKAREAQPTFLLFLLKIEYQQMDFSSSPSPRKVTEISDDELVFGAIKACFLPEHLLIEVEILISFTSSDQKIHGKGSEFSSKRGGEGQILHQKMVFFSLFVAKASS